MKQIFQDLKNGNCLIVEAPIPSNKKRHLIINTNVTLISSGTERMLLEFGKAGLVQKARQQPDKVKDVLDKVRTDGLITTLEAVRSKLSQPLPLGYCNVGVVGDLGEGVSEFKIGDRVVSNGFHADVVRAPVNLCAKIPDGVSDEQAAFTVVASIGLHGIRLASPTLGESFVVIGAGLIGLLTIQLLRAHGCNVLAIDYDESKLSLAKNFGADICSLKNGEDPISAGMRFSSGRGVDGVIIAASTKSNDPITQAAKMCRKRARIILVGATKLDISRSDFYEKEITFQVSCSYGPGRYDTQYEELGNDYPLGYVRWTEQRNFEAILGMIASGRLDVKPLITHRFDFEQAANAYELLATEKSSLGILLNYCSDISSRRCSTLQLRINEKYFSDTPVVGFVGAGNYASRMLIPAFEKTGARLDTISTSGGISGVFHGEKSGFYKATTDTRAMIESSDINTIVIATRHDSHAYFVKEALKARKNVFVEKPLAITSEEVDEIESIYNNISSEFSARLMVGFNRRFAPQVLKIKSLIDPIKEPKSFIMTMNPGAIPAAHWTQDISVGGGRIVGEACHLVDLMRYLAGSQIVSVQARRMGDAKGVDVVEDKAAIILGFADGSFGTIHYLANGASGFPKERVEVFVAGRILQLDNFICLKGFGWSKFKKLRLWRQDKGQNSCVKVFVDSIRNGSPAPISSSEIFEVARASIDIVRQLRTQ